MAGITHSAFRRLVADFGCHGALYTEMLSVKALLSENMHKSPHTKRRDHEKTVVYQLRLNGSEPVEQAIKHLADVSPDAIDINCGCPAPMVVRDGGGYGLFADLVRLEKIVQRVRNCWHGPLFVKFRLGGTDSNWEQPLVQRLELFERIGVDALVLHPRFANEKLKRNIRWETYAWVAQRTRLPLIANGDITGAQTVSAHFAHLDHVSGIMVGRMAVAKPWVFRELTNNKTSIDYGEIWQRFVSYVCEDFPEEKVFGRAKEFTAYFARNFLFGHQLHTAVQGAPDLDYARKRADMFFNAAPALCQAPSITGI